MPLIPFTQVAAVGVPLDKANVDTDPVSYTHLTLPTILPV